MWRLFPRRAPDASGSEATPTRPAGSAQLRAGDRVDATADRAVERRGVMSGLDRHQALLWFDPEGIVVDCNDNAAHLFGQSPAALLGGTFRTLLRLTGSGSEEVWGRVLAGKLTNEERGLRRPDGAEVWASVSYAPVHGNDGSLKRVVAILVDLSPWSWRPNDVSRPR